MEISRQCLLLASAVALGGCAPSMTNQIRNGKATLVKSTVSVENFGANYKITGLVSAGDQRTSLSTYATDCQRGYGTLTNYEYDSSTGVLIQNATTSGHKPEDMLFAGLCRLGVPMVLSMDSRLTDAQRNLRQQAAVNEVMQSNAIGAAQATQRRHDQAVRDASSNISDAIREQGNKTTQCQPNGNGYTCSQQ